MQANENVETAEKTDLNTPDCAEETSRVDAVDAPASRDDAPRWDCPSNIVVF